MDQIEKLNELTTLLEGAKSQIDELRKEMEKDQVKEPLKEIRIEDEGIGASRIVRLSETGQGIDIYYPGFDTNAFFDFKQIPDLIKALKELSGVE